MCYLGCFHRHEMIIFKKPYFGIKAIKLILQIGFFFLKIKLIMIFSFVETLSRPGNHTKGWKK